jgi:arsenate reductase
MNDTAAYNVLFLCTGNSARSILAESLLRHWGRDRFRAFSAGSHPKGEVHPLALEVLKESGLPVEGMRSKSWNEFSGPSAPRLDFVFTVCGNAAAETCPFWPGRPATAHWGVEDPAAVEGDRDTRLQAFRVALRELEARIRPFVDLPLKSMTDAELRSRLAQIGHA